MRDCPDAGRAGSSVYSTPLARRCDREAVRGRQPQFVADLGQIDSLGAGQREMLDTQLRKGHRQRAADDFTPAFCQGSQIFRDPFFACFSESLVATAGQGPDGLD